MKRHIKLAQQILKDAGLYKLDIDGDFGPATEKALTKYPGIDHSWPKARRIIACIQLGCKALHIDVGIIDGRWGPATEEAARQYEYYKKHNAMPAPFRPEEIKPNSIQKWPKESTAAFNDFYGPPGNSQLVRIQFPYPMKLAWSPYSKVSSTLCHKKVAESATRVFENVLKAYGEADIAKLKLNSFGGCYNKRQKRGGTSWSMHSWGIAFDFDPANNALRWGADRARFAQPEYEAWWKCWEDEGWISLGRQRNYDWMHVQAASI